MTVSSAQENSVSSPTIAEKILTSGSSIRFAMEFFPPRNRAEEIRVLNSLYTIARMDALFASVTYGAGGALAQRSFQLAKIIQTEFHIPVLAHMTTVNQTEEEIRVNARYLWKNGLHHVLALRGDPPGDPLAEWIETPQGINYASDLISVLQSEAPFEIAVAAFPEGHFRAPNLDWDTQVLVNKFRLGASFAITQMFFDVDDFLALRDRVAKQAPEYVNIPIIPNLMPITSVKVIRKLLQLSGSTMPAVLNERLDKAANGNEEKNREQVRTVGIDIATEIAQRLITEGVSCIQFCTLNYTKSTREVLANLGVAIPNMADLPSELPSYLFPE